MPITPKHEQVIETALHLTVARLGELAAALGYSAPPALQRDVLLASPLAKELRVIARYAEGYDLGEGDILPTIRSIARLLYPKPMIAKGYQFPPDFHKSDLGELVHAALCRKYPRDQRMTVGEVTKLLGVTRQTVHGWAEDSTLTPIYDHGQLTFTRKQVEYVQQKREERSVS